MATVGKLAINAANIWHFASKLPFLAMFRINGSFTASSQVVRIGVPSASDHIRSL